MPVKNADFTFNLNVSTGAYPVQKPKEVWQIQFSPQTMTISDLEELQRQGKAFCYNFKNVSESGLITQQEKTLSGFDYTNIIFYDIDKMPYQMDEYISPIPFKPSLAYTTISNGKEGKYGYRLIYAFDTPLTSIEEFDNVYYAVAAANGFTPRQYEDGTKYEFDYRKVNQQYFGGGYNSKTYKTDFVYSISDFSLFFNEGNMLRNQIPSCKSTKKKFIKNKDGFPNENNKTEREKNIGYYSELENPFYNDLFSLSPKAFIEKHQEYLDVYNRSVASALRLSDDGKYWIYPENYQEIKRNWTIDDTGKRKVSRWQIGSERTKRMYVTAQIMKFNIPNIKKEELIYNLVYERYHYYVNTDKKLNNKILIRIVNKVLSHDFELLPCKHSKFSINKDYWLNGNMTPNQAKNIVRKEIKEKEVMEYFDINLSIKENLQILKDKGIKVSKSYLYDLKKRLESKKDFPNENNVEKSEEESAHYSKMENNEDWNSNLIIQEREMIQFQNWA